uniref:GLOBIN domain-containing protein n=1 Tax=Meloidogyne hapla TaxID=6305 RepID=A0A1I8C0G9_MELHA
MDIYSNPQTEEAAIQFLQSKNILPTNKICANGHEMKLSIGNQVRWQCGKSKSTHLCVDKKLKRKIFLNGFNKAQKVDSRKIAAKKRLERGQTTGSSDNSSQNAKKDNILFDIKPFLSNKCSPHHSSQKQKRLGSVGNAFGLINLNNRSSNFEKNILNIEQSELIQKTWLLANEKIRLFAGPDRSFAFFTFDRIFERAPELKTLFGLSPNISLFDLDENQWDQHPFSRHVRIFNNILDLSVRNSSELEKEMLPVLFAYGQRHYRTNINEYFNEKTVRLFCSQIIGTLCDLLDKKLNLFAQEAWINMVTYLGRALLSGHCFACLLMKRVFVLLLLFCFIVSSQANTPKGSPNIRGMEGRPTKPVTTTISTTTSSTSTTTSSTTSTTSKNTPPVDTSTTTKGKVPKSTSASTTTTRKTTTTTPKAEESKSGLVIVLIVVIVFVIVGIVVVIVLIMKSGKKEDNKSKAKKGKKQQKAGSTMGGGNKDEVTLEQHTGLSLASRTKTKTKVNTFI